jgi:hypothetical protein
MGQPHTYDSPPEHVPCFALQRESFTGGVSCSQITSDARGAFRQYNMLRRVIDIIVQDNAAAFYSHFCRAEVSEYTPRQLRRMKKNRLSLGVWIWPSALAVPTVL